MYKKILIENDFYLFRENDGAHIPRDMGNTDYKEAIEWLKTENMSMDDLEAINPITIEDTIKKYSDALDRHIDMKAAEKQYSSGLSAVSYQESKNIKWAKEAKSFSLWRDDVWEYAVKILNDVESGAIEAPSIEEFIKNAPALVWL